MNQERLEEVRRALDRNDVFGHLPELPLRALIDRGTTASFGAGQTIFRRGDPGQSMMVLLAGRVRIATCSVDGRESVLNFIEPGHVFGEIALLDGKPRTADAIAMTTAELFVLRREALLHVLDTFPRVALELIEVLCAKLRHTTLVVEDNMFLGVAPRIARALLRLAEAHGRRQGSAIRLELRLRQADLGAYVGLSREITNRQLKAWRGEALIAMDRGCIVILNEARLQLIAEG
jgi:CRP/FNR family cyclic AMP-dependent transcriptional regulator